MRFFVRPPAPEASPARSAVAPTGTALRLEVVFLALGPCLRPRDYGKHVRCYRGRVHAGKFS
jgi:hypothetical protein